MRFFYTFFFVLLAAGLSLVTYLVSFQRFEQDATRISAERLSLYQAGLRSTLERVAHLPHLVVIYPETLNVLRQGKADIGYNEYLKSVNNNAKAAALYLLDRDGNTIAASNYDNNESFVGNNYRFRRYYLDAIETGSGNFFAVGVTTHRPGYFLSRAIYDDGKPIGVAVVKVEFIELLKYWEDAGEHVMITNSDGVVVLASNSERLYKTLRPIPEERLTEMKESRKFANYTLEPLSFSARNHVFADRVKLDRQLFSVTTVNTSGIGWKLHFLTPLDGAQNSALALAFGMMLLQCLGGVVYLYVRSRVERDKLSLVAVEAERVREANALLEKEVAERIRTEEQLRETQAELIQSSRLAALGKMSAAIVHEVNQPVSAIRTYTSSGMLLLGKRRIKDAREVFEQIANMTERLGAITSDLLVFSRKPVSRPQPIDVNKVTQSILSERKPEFEAAGVEVTEDLWKRELPVAGSRHRFEQLVGNLVQNAVQACETGGKGRVVVTSMATPASAVLMVSDNGHGIPDDVMDQLFDPFFTTKEVGKGVGLGLAICYAIVDEAGGRIYGENRPEGGANLIVELPLAKQRSGKKAIEVVNG